MTKIFMQTDGGSRGNPGPAGAGVFIYNEKNEIIRKAHLFLGTMTNNEAEYQAVILGLETLKKVFGKEKLRNLDIVARLDSELVCKQLRGEYQVKEEKLVPLFMKIWNARVSDFPQISFEHIPREKNEEADKLANQAMDEGETEQGGLF
ncbi:MAG TPA: ribonuclease HI family protein [Candidatus Paceibacterota bacterium]|nr:ribonuclease HI family protein [Candidatus Paceibacterota bacterium]